MELIITINKNERNLYCQFRLLNVISIIWEQFLNNDDEDDDVILVDGTKLQSE